MGLVWSGEEEFARGLYRCIAALFVSADRDVWFLQKPHETDD
jgi:hypothetical protein